MGREIVENDMDFALRILGHDGVHEIEELDATPSFVVTADHLAAGDVEGVNAGAFLCSRQMHSRPRR